MNTFKKGDVCHTESRPAQPVGPGQSVARNTASLCSRTSKMKCLLTLSLAKPSTEDEAILKTNEFIY